MSWGFRSSLRIDLPSPRRLCVVQRDVRRLPRRCCQQHSCHRLRHRIATPDSDELAHDAPHHVLQEADACDSHRQQASAAEDSDVGRTLRRLTVCLAPRASRRRHRAELSLCEKAVVQDLERNMVDRGHLYCRDLAHGIVGACRNGRKRQEVMPPHQGLRSRPHGLEPEERAFLAPDAFRQAAQGRRAAVRRRIGPSIARRCARQGALHGPGINPGEPFRQIIYVSLSSNATGTEGDVWRPRRTAAADVAWQLRAERRRKCQHRFVDSCLVDLSVDVEVAIRQHLARVDAAVRASAGHEP
mmetsp:Transcript_58575/g.163389  ORF Transcript_58575/g.163389 Transcript_58575/m.163389 type:complete len:300 (+) Transcript_58575:115-1014(+)